VRRLLAAAAVLTACNTNFAPQWHVVDLRILAVRSDVVGGSGTLADPSPGDTVRLTALVANPLARAPFRVRFATCLPTGTEALPPCLDTARLRDLDALLADPSVVMLGEGGAGFPYEWSLDVPVPDVSAAFAPVVARAEQDPGLACSLYLELPLLVIVDAGGRRDVAVKRVRIVDPQAVAGTPLEGGYVPNHDPSLSGAWFVPVRGASCADGEPIAVPCTTAATCGPGATCGPNAFCEFPIPAAAGTLCARPGDGATDAFYQCAPDGTRTAYEETLDYQWYSTGGDFPGLKGQANATGHDIDFDRPAGAFTLFAIVRDARGGVGWIARDVPAAP
jgi:hypothetical protein